MLVTALRIIVKVALMGVRVCGVFLAANGKSLVLLRPERYRREWLHIYDLNVMHT